MTSGQEMIVELSYHISLSNEMKDILSVVDRALFSPTCAKHFSYSLDAVYMGNGRWVQSPLTAVTMAQYLELKKRDKVLEIGCGSGYQAAILSKLCHQVLTIDCDPVILHKAQKTFETLRMNNVRSRIATREEEWEPKETFDRIVFSLCVEKISNIFFDKLAENGILVAPIKEKNGFQTLTKFFKRKGRISKEVIEPCSFISMSDVVKKCNPND